MKMEVYLENLSLVKKMQVLDYKKGALNPDTITAQSARKPRPPSAESLHRNFKVKQNIKVILENQALLNRLKQAKSNYGPANLSRDKCLVKRLATNGSKTITNRGRAS